MDRFACSISDLCPEQPQRQGHPTHSRIAPEAAWRSTTVSYLLSATKSTCAVYCTAECQRRIFRVELEQRWCRLVRQRGATHPGRLRSRLCNFRVDLQSFHTRASSHGPRNQRLLSSLTTSVLLGAVRSAARREHVRGGSLDERAFHKERKQ